jgi:hypothetical protein
MPNPRRHWSVAMSTADYAHNSPNPDVVVQFTAEGCIMAAQNTFDVGPVSDFRVEAITSVPIPDSDHSVLVMVCSGVPLHERTGT